MIFAKFGPLGQHIWPTLFQITCQCEIDTFMVNTPAVLTRVATCLELQASATSGKCAIAEPCHQPTDLCNL